MKLLMKTKIWLKFKIKPGKRKVLATFLLELETILIKSVYFRGLYGENIIYL